MGGVVFEDCKPCVKRALSCRNHIENLVEFIIYTFIHIIEAVIDFRDVFFYSAYILANFHYIFLELVNFDFEDIGFGNFLLGCWHRFI